MKNHKIYYLIFVVFFSCSEEKNIDFQEKAIDRSLIEVAVIDSMEIFDRTLLDSTTLYATVLDKGTKSMLKNLNEYFLKNCNEAERISISNAILNGIEKKPFIIKSNSGHNKGKLNVVFDHDSLCEKCKRIEMSSVVYDSLSKKAAMYIGVKCLTNKCNLSAGGLVIFKEIKDDQWDIENYVKLWDEIYDDNIFTKDSLATISRQINVCQ